LEGAYRASGRPLRCRLMQLASDTVTAGQPPREMSRSTAVDGTIKNSEWRVVRSVGELSGMWISLAHDRRGWRATLRYIEHDTRWVRGELQIYPNRLDDPASGPLYAAPPDERLSNELAASLPDDERVLEAANVPGARSTKSDGNLRRRRVPVGELATLALLVERESERGRVDGVVWRQRVADSVGRPKRTVTHQIGQALAGHLLQQASGDRFRATALARRLTGGSPGPRQLSTELLATVALAKRRPDFAEVVLDAIEGAAERAEETGEPVMIAHALADLGRWHADRGAETRRLPAGAAQDPTEAS
jgi:hypothetical protein